MKLFSEVDLIPIEDLSHFVQKYVGEFTHTDCNVFGYGMDEHEALVQTVPVFVAADQVVGQRYIGDAQYLYFEGQFIENKFQDRDRAFNLASQLGVWVSPVYQDEEGYDFWKLTSDHISPIRGAAVPRADELSWDEQEEYHDFFTRKD